MFVALGQAMLYVDGMNGVISHIGTIQWLYTLCAAKVGITSDFRQYTKAKLLLLSRPGQTGGQTDRQSTAINA